MSGKALNALYSLPAAKKPKGNVMIVLQALCDSAGGENDLSVWYSVPKLAAKCGIHERTLQRTLQSLAKHGTIEVTQRLRQRADGGNSSNVYDLVVGGDGLLVTEGDGGSSATKGGMVAAAPPTSRQQHHQDGGTIATNRRSAKNIPQLDPPPEGGGTMLEELVTAVVWVAAKSNAIRNAAGYKNAIRKRLCSSTPTIDDLAALECWRKQHTRQQPISSKPLLPIELVMERIASAKAALRSKC